MTDVRLVDLDVFKRYSLAIRQETAPAEEVLALLEATRRQVVAVAGPTVGAIGHLEDARPVADVAEASGPGDGDVPDEEWAPESAAWAAEEAAGAAAAGAAAAEEEQEAVRDVRAVPEPHQGEEGPRPVRRRVRRAAGPERGAGR